MKKIIISYSITLAFILISVSSCEKYYGYDKKETLNDTTCWHFIKTSDSTWDSIRVVVLGHQVWTDHDRADVGGGNAWPKPSIQYSKINDLDSKALYRWLNKEKDTDTGAYYHYINPTYGSIFNWYFFMNGENCEKAHGVCPEGFHIPSASEWDDLEAYLKIIQPHHAKRDAMLSYIEQSGSIANALATNTDSWRASDILGTPGYDKTINNSTSFNAIPAGTLVVDTSNGRPIMVRTGAGRVGIYATSTESNAGKDMYCTRIFYYNSPSMGRGALDKSRLARVRCIKDDNTINKTKE